MANTYARIKTVYSDFKDEDLGFDGYTNDMTLTLTAFVGVDKHTQLTVVTRSTLESQCGVAYIALGDEEVDLLISALMERKLGKISATGLEKSIFCPINDDED